MSKKRLKNRIEPEYRDLLDEIKNRFKFVAEAEDRQRELELDDLRFCESGSQWPADIKRDREAEGRPCLEVDRLNTFVRNICNEQRQARPQPQVNPCDSGASKETAEVLQGMIRHIMYLSNGDTAIDTAFESMVRCGRGYVRVLTEYANDESFDLDVVVKRVPNPHMVYLDPSATEPDGCDLGWAMIASDLSREEYRNQFPDSELAQMSISDWKSIGDDAPEWADGNGTACRIIEYFKKEKEKVKLVKLSDGKVLNKSDVTEFDVIEDERDGSRTKVMWYKVNAVEVLEKTEWPGKHIPIVPFYGSELWLEGKRIFSGLVRSAKDPQRHYNYMKSKQAEAIALAPLAPVAAAKGSLGSGAMREAWKNINKKALGVVEYEAYDAQNRALPPPQRMSTEVNIGAITEAMMGSVDDLKATTGMFDPSLGNRENGQSGVAIRQLQRQGQTGNYHFQDNSARSIRQLGRILIDVFPKVYPAQQVVRIVKPDDSVGLVTINGPTGEMDEKKGIERIYDITVGTYDVTVNVGPSYQTKRQENLALLESLMQGPLGQLLTMAAPDLVVSMMDFNIAPQLQERLKKALPPQFQDKEEGEQPQLPPEVVQHMQEADQLVQMGQQHIQQLTGMVQEMGRKMESKAQELESKERIAAMQAQVELVKLEMQQTGQAGLAVLQAELAGISQRLALLNVDKPIDTEGQEEEPAEAAGVPQPMAPQPAGAMSPAPQEM